MDEYSEEPSRAWYAPGLYRRIQERRRWRPQRAPRKPWRQRLRERGLHWSVELVVGVFVAVLAVSLATVALSGTHGSAAQLIPTRASAPVMSPTPGCIAAPIPGSTKRVCTQ